MNGFLGSTPSKASWPTVRRESNVVSSARRGTTGTLTRVKLVSRPELGKRQKLVGMQDNVCVGGRVQDCADARMMREGTGEHAEESASSLSLGHKTFRHDVLLLERDFSVLDSKGTDVAVSIKSNGLGAAQVVIPLVVGVLHNLATKIRK